jgi:4'-phosphopantetheinyl transferase EntD
MAMRELEGLFDDPRVVVRSAPVDPSHVSRLGAREAAAIERAVDKRKREYATGRALARDALAALGVQGFELLNGEDRCPIWPEGVAGTVSHSDMSAVVAVGRLEDVGTLGVDVEHRARLDEGLWRHTMLPAEIAWLEERDAPLRGGLALAIFSLKEALYKAQYPRSREYMAFADLQVELASVELAPAPLASARPAALAALGSVAFAPWGEARCVFQRQVGPFPRGFVARGRIVRLPPREVGSEAGLDARAGTSEGLRGELVSAVCIPPP